MLVIALTVRFLLELILLIVLAIWGFQSAQGLALGLLFGLAASFGGALVWGLFISPKRRFELGRIPRLALELALFAIAACALWQMDRPLIGLLLFATACADRFGLIWLRRRELARRYSGR
jgi:uncharacterized membrane-anchored protein YitT (DUF2179 family)